LVGIKIDSPENLTTDRDGGATRPLPRDGGVEEHHGEPTDEPRPKV